MSHKRRLEKLEEILLKSEEYYKRMNLLEEIVRLGKLEDAKERKDIPYLLGELLELNR